MGGGGGGGGVEGGRTMRLDEPSSDKQTLCFNFQPALWRRLVARLQDGGVP